MNSTACTANPCPDLHDPAVLVEALADTPTRTGPLSPYGHCRSVNTQTVSVRRALCQAPAKMARRGPTDSAPDSSRSAKRRTRGPPCLSALVQLLPTAAVSCMKALCR
eukprot:scaffold795_cov375-Prasinococcus_capsulatus_cf.AAC.28